MAHRTPCPDNLGEAAGAQEPVPGTGLANPWQMPGTDNSAGERNPMGVMVDRTGIEPVTPAFSVQCSTS